MPLASNVNLGSTQKFSSSVARDATGKCACHHVLANNLLTTPLGLEFVLSTPSSSKSSSSSLRRFLSVPLANASSNSFPRDAELGIPSAHSIPFRFELLFMLSTLPASRNSRRFPVVKGLVNSWRVTLFTEAGEAGLGLSLAWRRGVGRSEVMGDSEVLLGVDEWVSSVLVVVGWFEVFSSSSSSCPSLLESASSCVCSLLSLFESRDGLRGSWCHFDG